MTRTPPWQRRIVMALALAALLCVVAYEVLLYSGVAKDMYAQASGRGWVDLLDELRVLLVTTTGVAAAVNAAQRRHWLKAVIFILLAQLVWLARDTTIGDIFVNWLSIEELHVVGPGRVYLLGALLLVIPLLALVEERPYHSPSPQA